MLYTLEEIKYDLKNCSARQFYLKHIVRSDNWCFENVLAAGDSSLQQLSDEFRMIISESLGISFNSIMVVGSSKIGYSLSPTEKLFCPFRLYEDGNSKASDIDVAIISSELFMNTGSCFEAIIQVSTHHYIDGQYIMRYIVDI